MCSWATEQVPTTSILFGLRAGAAVYSGLFERYRFAPRFDVEAEAKLAPAYTGGGADLVRPQYFAPVFGLRVHGVASVRLLPSLSMHLLAGVGSESVVSSSPFMANETDAMAYWGLGGKIQFSDDGASGPEKYKIRFDLRQGVMPGRMSGVSSAFELQFGIETRIGSRRKSRVAKVLATREPAAVVVKEPPIVPPADIDHDGLLDAVDACPAAAEDIDGFEDSDGCPEPDNDGDGIADLQDKCPLQAENINSFEDDDGCLDVVPPITTTTLISFVKGKASLSVAVQSQLTTIANTAKSLQSVQITLVASFGSNKDAALAGRRLESAKWFLIDRGIDPAVINTSVENGSADRKDSIEIRLSGSKL
jgi:outer membrane protein OmpA-like peptidoglycan-associated protein